MSQLLQGATIIVLLLVGIVSLDIMGFAFWKGNQFPVEGKVSTLSPHEVEYD
jgi:3-dehydrosphinganine reductase